MKKYLGFLCAMLLVFGVLGVAGASPVIFSDTVDFTASGPYFGEDYLEIKNIGSYSHSVSFVPDADRIDFAFWISLSQRQMPL